jgi:hypothetical protein
MRDGLVDDDYASVVDKVIPSDITAQEQPHPIAFR